jgi:hypothetical protein
MYVFRKLIRIIFEYFFFVDKEIDEEDMQTLDALLPSNAGERKTLADIILAKLDGGEANPTAMIQKVQQGQYCVIIQS